MQNMHLAKNCLKCHLLHKVLVGWELCNALIGKIFVLVSSQRCCSVGYQQIIALSVCAWRAALSWGRSQVISLCDKGGVPVVVGRRTV